MIYEENKNDKGKGVSLKKAMKELKWKENKDFGY